MSSPFDCDAELALLLGSEPSLAHRLNPTVRVNITHQSLHISIIEIEIRVIFNSSHCIPF